MTGPGILHHLLGRGRSRAADGVPTILILAEARTGSNLLCERLKAVPGHLGLFEIFNSVAAHGLSQFPEGRRALVPDAGPAAPDETDPRLRNALSADPPRAIATLSRAARAAGWRALSYKVFPEQLPPRRLRSLLATGPALLVVLGRRRIDAYASFQKALAARAWIGTDTTEVPVTAQLGAVQHYWANRDIQTRAVWNAARKRGLRRLALDYDRDIDGGRVAGSVDRIFAAAGLDLRLPADAPPTTLVRQRRPLADPFDAFENGKAFRREVEENGALDFMLGSVVDELTD